MKGKLSSQLIMTVMAASVATSSYGDNEYFYDREQNIINAQTFIDVTREFVKAADEMYVSPVYEALENDREISEAECFDVRAYRKELAESQRKNNGNLRTLFQEEAIGSFAFVRMKYRSDRMFNSVIEKADAIGEYCKVTHDADKDSSSSRVASKSSTSDRKNNLQSILHIIN